MANATETLIFLHIPKTAGSTFHTIVTNKYTSRETRNLFGSRYKDPKIVQFINTPDSEKASIKLLKGHMPYGLHSYLPQNSQYMTILRDPVERVISEYYYIIANEQNRLHKKVTEEKMSISELVESGLSVGLNNGQCRFLYGDLDAYKFDRCDQVMLNVINKNITKHFLWLGITERFDESLLVLAEKLRWTKSPFYFRENVSKIRKKKAIIDPSEIEVIKKFNSLDISLFNQANLILDKEISKIDNFANKLECFKKENTRLQKRWGWLPDKFRRRLI